MIVQESVVLHILKVSVKEKVTLGCLMKSIFLIPSAYLTVALNIRSASEPKDQLNSSTDQSLKRGKILE